MQSYVQYNVISLLVLLLCVNWAHTKALCAGGATGGGLTGAGGGGHSLGCRCPIGYERTPHGDGCRDINECDMTPAVCTTGICVNTDGSYYCYNNKTKPEHAIPVLVPAQVPVVSAASGAADTTGSITTTICLYAASLLLWYIAM